MAGRRPLPAGSRRAAARRVLMRGARRSNFEWNFAFDLKFGLYEWNDDGTQRRRLRDGAEVRRTPAQQGCALLPCVPEGH
jgi:hypothetical protein